MYVSAALEVKQRSAYQDHAVDKPGSLTICVLERKKERKKEI